MIPYFHALFIQRHGMISALMIYSPLRLKKVCPVYNTYPITELKMYWLIQWHLCVYRGVKVWSFSYLLLSVKCHKLIKVIVSKLSKKPCRIKIGYSICL